MKVARLFQQDALAFDGIDALDEHIKLLVDLKKIALASKSTGQILIGLGDGKRVTMLTGGEVQ